MANGKIEIGDGATLRSGSDSYAYTIVEVSKTGHRFTMQADRSRRVDGGPAFSETQTFEHTRDENGRTLEVTRRRNGEYFVKGVEVGGWGRVTVGRRSAHYDPHF